MNLQIDNRVRIIKGSHHYGRICSCYTPKYRSNPKDIIGTIKTYRRVATDNYNWAVDWDDGTSNYYRETDLEKVSCISPSYSFKRLYEFPYSN